MRHRTDEEQSSLLVLGPMVELMAGTGLGYQLGVEVTAPGRTSLGSPSQPGLLRRVRGERFFILLVVTATEAAEAACL